MTNIGTFEPAESGRNRLCIDLSDALAAYIDDRFDSRAEVGYAGLDAVLTTADDRESDLVCADCGALQGSVESFCWRCQHDEFQSATRYEATADAQAATDGGDDVPPEVRDRIEDDPVLTVEDWLEHNGGERDV